MIYTIEELNNMTEKEAMEKTQAVIEHPEGYEGPCLCQSCVQYSQ